MKKSQLQKYAKLIARKGVNVQKGQDVRVRACPDQLDFVRMVVEECYNGKKKSINTLSKPAPHGYL